MTITIPAFMLWLVAGAFLWVATGWLLNLVITAYDPNFALGITHQERAILMVGGPILLLVLITMINDRHEAQRIRREVLARVLFKADHQTSY